MISVLIVEDQNTIRQLLKTYLEQESDLEVVGVAVNGEEALRKIEQLQPEVVVMDIEMPKVDGLSATKIISEHFTNTKVLILSTHDDDYYLNDALQLGAKGYLLKNTPPQQLADTIRAINQGYFQLGPGLLKKSLPKLAVVKISNQSPSIGERKAHQSEGTDAWGLETGKEPNHKNKKDYSSSPSKKSTFRQSGKTLHSNPNPQLKQTSLSNYLGLGVLLNMVIWTLVLAYLKFSIPIYTSKLGVKIIETNPATEVMPADESKTTSVPSNWLPSSRQDSQNDYIYIATSSQILEQAAYLMGITVKEFDEPEITVDTKNGTIDFLIVGNTPEESQKKAMSLYQVITKQIETLRTKEIQKQEQKIKVTLESAREKLNIAQQKLSEYKSISGSKPNEQTKHIAVKKDITVNRAEVQQLIAQNKKLKTQIIELEDSLKPSSKNQFEVDSIRRDLQVAEEIFAATLTKLDLGKENIYSIYPPIQLVTEPTRPEKPSSPSLSYALWSGISGSLLVTIALVLLGFDRQKLCLDPTNN